MVFSSNNSIIVIQIAALISLLFSACHAPDYLELKNIKDYSGIYTCQLDGYKYSLLIHFFENKPFGQIKKNALVDSEYKGAEAFMKLSNFELSSKGSFNSDEFSGGFKSALIDGELVNTIYLKNVNGLNFIEEKLLNFNWESEDYSSFYYGGTYSEFSYELINKKQILSVHPSVLKIMRAEIYARYGCKFSDPELKEHLEPMGWWYKGTSSNVDHLLNPIEVLNAEMLKRQASANRNF